MANSEIVKAEDLAASLKDKVEDKIRNAFVDLITDEQWRALTAAALTRFTEPRQVRSRYDPPTDVPSIFDEMVNDVLRARMAERIKAELDKPEYFEGMWTALGPQPGEADQAIVKAVAPELVHALFAGVVQQAVGHMRTAMEHVMKVG